MTRTRKEVVEFFQTAGYLLLGVLIIPVAAVVGVIDYFEAKRCPEKKG